MATMHPSDRKKQLIAQGALYRAEILVARENVEESLRPDSLARGMLNHAASTAVALFSNKTGAPAGRNLQSILPLVMSGISVVSKKTGLKPMLRGVLVAALTAGAAAFFARKEGTPAEEQDISA
jgi:hypothetical protein